MFRKMWREKSSAGAICSFTTYRHPFKLSWTNNSGMTEAGSLPSSSSHRKSPPLRAWRAGLSPRRCGHNPVHSGTFQLGADK
jgi:hypothetical protein